MQADIGEPSGGGGGVVHALLGPWQASRRQGYALICVIHIPPPLLSQGTFEFCDFLYGLPDIRPHFGPLTVMLGHSRRD